MLFNSLIFIEFLCLFFVGWPAAKRHETIRYLYLITFSFLFYAWATPWWLLLLIADGLIDYVAALGMVRFPTRKRVFLGLSLAGNLGLLFTFKYAHFLATNVNVALAELGIGFRFDVTPLPLPIGISFYTFQSLSYTIGAYRGQLTPTTNILQFFAYISLWPQLVAGPIERAARLLPQLKTVMPVSADEAWNALALILRGYFKKMVIADNLAPAVNAAFSAPAVAHSLPLWWLVGTMFALQIYCDFSGYTDIARGLAKWLGYDLMLNFDHPYGAIGIREFWRRWHISLSGWFRDYVYIPLGGSQRGELRGHVNMWITMLMSGLWHGANWTFIAWAALHALYLTIERITRWPDRLVGRGGGRSMCATLTFALVTIAWVFFRAASIGQAVSIVGAMLDPRALHLVLPIGFAASALFFLAVGLGMVVNEFYGTSRRVASWQMAPWLEPATLAVIATVCVFWRGPSASFIYFQF